MVSPNRNTSARPIHGSKYCFPPADMAAFVSPSLYGTANTHHARPPRVSRSCWRLHASKQLLRVPLSCRMRNREGFQLPPRVPTDPTERRRAIELLGCCTQRKHLLPATAVELESLVGQIPPNRLLAQQWKGAMQRDLKRANQQKSPTAFKHRKHLMQILTLSERNATVSRCFILLEAVRRRYLANQSPNPKTLEELNKQLGTFPKTSLEAHRFIRALARMQRDRTLSEKRPPRIPTESFSDLYYASMLLGWYAVRGSVGRQTDKLEALLGAIPRNKNVAHSWQKLVKAAIRKKKRREQKELRRREIEKKRFERQLRKLRRKQLAAVQEQSTNSTPPPDHLPPIQHVHSLNRHDVGSDHANRREARSLIEHITQFLAKLRCE